MNKDHREQVPYDDIRGGNVANQRVMGPIVGVTVDIAWSRCAAQPASPEEERCKILDLLGVADLLDFVERSSF